METLYGNIYIVPNDLMIYDKRTEKEFGYIIDNVTGLQVCFRGVIANDESYDWFSTHYPKFDGNMITPYFPVECFLGKKENDTVELLMHNKKVILTLAHSKYKYGIANSENFEDKLYNLTQSFAGVSREEDYIPSLSTFSQFSILIATHEKYSRSINKKAINPNNFIFSEKFIEQCKIMSKEKPKLSFVEKLLKTFK